MALRARASHGIAVRRSLGFENEPFFLSRRRFCAPRATIEGFSIGLSLHNTLQDRRMQRSAPSGERVASRISERTMPPRPSH